MSINRIGLKLGAVIIALFLVVLLALGFVMDRLFSAFYHKNMSKDVEELAAHFANMAKSHESDSGNMIQMFAEFSNVSIYLVDVDGSITPLGCLRVADRSFVESREMELLLSGKPVNKEFRDAEGKEYFVSAKPILDGEHMSSAIYVLSSMKGVDQSLARVRSLLVLSGFGAFLLALGFTYIVSQVLSRPLVQMEQATRRIAKGNLETRLEIRSKDEVGTLAAAINDLAGDLQRYRHTRQELFANVSHELRTPITYLEGYARVLKDELYDTEEEKQQYLDIIHQESLRLDRLIHDLFELSKMEEGKINLTFEWVDMKEVVEYALSKVQLKARQKDLSLHSEIKGSPLPVYADGLRMEQIVLNLLENAIRYTEKGTVSVFLIGEKKRLRLVVEDTGIGIPEEELPYIFERFYRVEKSRSRQYGGTGLGLAIVKTLVELQGGTIAVSSRQGEGTRFEITFSYQNPPQTE